MGGKKKKKRKKKKKDQMKINNQIISISIHNLNMWPGLLALVSVSCATDELELGHADTLQYASGFPADSTADQPFICDYRALAVS